MRRDTVIVKMTQNPTSNQEELMDVEARLDNISNVQLNNGDERKIYWYFSESGSFIDYLLVMEGIGAFNGSPGHVYYPDGLDGKTDISIMYDYDIECV